MTDGNAEKNVAAGLCTDCVHARRIESDRGSVFVMCELSAKEPSFAKYPRLPVISCRGYVKGSKKQTHES